ncbi:6-phospho-3-hexuloisomerase [Niallia nealsonii]|uniref:6-phospho-3-hexuloisomerase n=1 Tax=Niallia nealsonii TaxID=115979 RepID=A0A2N0YZ41_9BACI|nr:6-phospho-3-hexuloisomerase [Niallia nealsonii]PKG22515.1 6-phospho-3-hexuloisomerase [Niallia nealsonii]
MTKLASIQTEIHLVLSQVKETLLEETAELLKSKKRIFVIGEGRSGLMAKSFAMRLMHLGATVYVVGETITPSIAGDDVLVAISGSGKTKSVVWTAEAAKSLGCYTIAVTTDSSSPLANTASSIITIPASTKYRKEHELDSIQPLGSLFDQCAHIVFDTICLCYAEQNKVEFATAFKNHSNLE